MTTNQAPKTNPIAKVISLLLALFLTACSLAQSNPTSTPETQTEIPTVQAAGLELSATATAPEPTPTPEPTQTPEQALAEFKESAEYKQGLQDYLNTMGLKEEQVIVTLEIKVINGVKHQFILVLPEYSKLNDDQKGNGLRYDPCPLFIMEDSRYREVIIRDLAGNFIGTTASFGDKDSSTSAYQNKLKEFGLVSLSSAFSNRYMSENNNPDYWTNIVSSNEQELKIKEMYYPVDVRSAFEDFNGSQEELKVKVDEHFKQRSKDILSYIVKYNLQGKTTIELANEIFHYNTYVGVEKMPLN